MSRAWRVLNLNVAEVTEKKKWAAWESAIMELMAAMKPDFFQSGKKRATWQESEVNGENIAVYLAQ